MRDAALGRVLQADPFVQEPTSSQSFNRYTYVFNNPLSYTDPSGFITLRQVIGIAVGIALAYFLGPLVSELWHALLVGFASGFVSGAIITGNLKSALKSGLIGAAIAGVMFQVTGGAADKGDPNAPKSGGAGDNIHSNSFEGANSVVNTTQTASSDALEMVAEQGGSTAAQSVGQATESNVRELSKVYVYGNPVAEGATLSQVRRLALGTNSLFQLRHDMAEALVESYATDLSPEVVNSFRKTYNNLNVIYKEVRRIVGGRMAFASGVGTVVFTATMFTPIGFTRGVGTKLLSKIISKDGFLFGGITVRTPFNIPVQRFGNMSIARADYWGVRLGSNKFLNRTFAAIKPEWNDLTQLTKGVIPKGTILKFGIIGPQGILNPGGSLQFIVQSRFVKEQITKLIIR